MVGDPQAIEAGVLGQPRLVDQLVRTELLAGQEVADAHAVALPPGDGDTRSVHSRAPAPGGDRDRSRSAQGRSARAPAAAVLRLQGRAGNQVVARLLDPVRRGPRPFFDEDELWAPPEEQQDPREARIEAEWEKLRPVHRFFAEATLDFYKQVRTALLNAFGAQRDGDEVAVDRVLAYYRSLVRVGFQGFQLWVHPDLAARLEIAERRLGASYPLQSAYGANIRFNTNNPAVLSDHSYGSAIDINGVDEPERQEPRPRLGARADDRRRSPASTRAGTRPAARSTPIRAATTRCWPRPAGSRSAATGCGRRSPTRSRSSARRSGSRRSAARRPAGRRSSARCCSLRRRSAGAGATAPSPRPARRRAATATARRCARFVFPTELGDQSRDWPPELVQATVDLLALLARTFRATFTAHGRVAPTARSPSDAQLALHGFLSVAPEVVAALGGSDAGDLRWLGAMSGGTKDYMHFELRERPKLY